MANPQLTARRAAGLLLLVGLAASRLAVAGAPSPPPGEWLMPRYDAHQTGFAPGVAKLSSPAVRWRLPIPSQLGAAFGADVDLDGQQDLLSVSAGRLVAQTIHGKILWQTASLGIAWVQAIVDMDGDGAPEVVAVGPTAAHLLQLSSGAVLWSSPAGVYQSLALAAVADFGGDGKPDLALADSSGPAASTKPLATVYSFAEVTATVQAMTDMPGADGHFPYGSHQQVVDVDGDGVADLLVPGYQRLGAFSGKTGQQMALSPQIDKMFVFLPLQSWRPAAATTAPYIVWSASNASGASWQQQVGWLVLQKQGSELAVVWKYQAPVPASEAVAVVEGSGGDLDGDDQGELVISRYANSQWQIEARDLATGQTLTSSDGAAWPNAKAGLGPVLVGAFRHAKETLLVVRLQADRLAPSQGPLRLVKWSRTKGFALVADLGDGQWWPGNRAKELGPPKNGSAPLPTMLSLQTGQEAPELLILRDKDGDGRPELLERLQVAAGAEPNAQAVQLLQSQALPATALPLTVIGANGGLRLVLSATDGQVAVWDSNFQLRNDANGDGKADLQRHGAGQVLAVVGRWQPSDPVPSLLLAVGPQLAAFSLAGAGPAKPPLENWRISLNAGVTTLNMADTDGNGSREALVGWQPGGQTVKLRGYGQGGAELFTWSPPPPLMRWSAPQRGLLVHDVDEDGADDLLLTMAPQLPQSAPLASTSLWSGKSQKLLWAGTAACAGLADVPTSLDLLSQPPRAVAAPYTSRIACNALTGEMLVGAENQTGGYGLPMVAELNGSAPADMVMAGPALVQQALDGATLKQLWTAEDKRMHGAPAALVQVKGQALSVHLAPAAAELQVRKALTGEVVWAKVLVNKKIWPAESAPVHNFAAGRLVVLGGLQGKEEPAAVVSTAEGLLYAVRVSDGELLWTFDSQGAVGALLTADIDGDGALELLVALPTGEFVALDGNVATAVASVRDIAALPAGDASADIDLQEETTQVSAAWPAAPLAQGYLARLVDDTGAQVVPPTAVANLQAQFQDLYLQPGRTYRWAVASYASVGPDASFSAETWSDGVTVVDQSPPWFENVKCAPACAVLPGTEIEVMADVFDRTRLASMGLELRDTATTSTAPLAAQQWPWLASHFALSWKRLMAEPGAYKARLSATDLAGHSAQIAVDIYVCKPGQVVKGSLCGLPDPPAAAAIEVAGSEVEGCGAGRVPGAAAAVLGWLLMVVAVGLVGRRGPL